MRARPAEPGGRRLFQGEWYDEAGYRVALRRRDERRARMIKDQAAKGQFHSIGDEDFEAYWRRVWGEDIDVYGALKGDEA